MDTIRCKGLYLHKGESMVRVLFVCLGNICRSPMAEALFLHKVRAANLSDHISADSAGTGNWHVGAPPHPGTRKVLTANGVRYDHRARQIQPEDLCLFDYVVVMDEENHRDVLAMPTGTAELRRLMEFAPDTGVHEVPDPYYTGNFREVFGLITVAVDGFLHHVREARAL